MKILKILFFSIFFANFLIANPTISYINHDKILSDFDIENNQDNKKMVISIYKSIDKSDRNLFKKIVLNKSYHTQVIRQKLDDLDAPEFMLYLAMVESQLSNKATSQVRAGGIWQFMPNTAKKYGLTVNRHIDERRDPIVSTDAAYEYMSYLKDYFGKWYLAAMAYNCGEACLSKSIKSVGSDDFDTLLNSNALPNETKNFVKKIIKYSYIAKNSSMIKILDKDSDKNKLIKIPVNGGEKLANIAKKANVPISAMKDINVHIRGVAAPKNGNYHFYIPTENYETYIANGGVEAIKEDNKAKLNFKISNFLQEESKIQTSRLE